MSYKFLIMMKIFKLDINVCAFVITFRGKGCLTF